MFSPFLGNYVISPVHRLSTSGTRHVLEDQVRVSRNVFAQVVGERDTVFVVCTAGAIRNDDLDRLPRKVHRLGALWSGRESGANEHREAGHCGPAYYRTFHLKPPDYENVCIEICKICVSWR